MTDPGHESTAATKLTEAYNRMMERIRHAFEEAEARATPPPDDGGDG